MWRRLETNHTIIHYRSVKDLGKFCAKVKSSPNDWGLKMLFSGSHEEALLGIVSKKTDALFEAVQKVLGMQKKMEKVTIKIYPNKPDLEEVFSNIYYKPCNLRAWYRSKNNTVYINANDLHEGILAHELAHAISDHYLLVRPPRKTAEIIARYVSGNLKRNIRSYHSPGPAGYSE